MGKPKKDIKKKDIDKDLDITFTHNNNTEETVDVDIDKDIDIDKDVHVDVKEHVDVKKDVNIHEDTNVHVDIKEDVHVDIDENVHISTKEETTDTKNVNINTNTQDWHVEVEVKADTLLQDVKADKVHLDNDTNDVDNSNLINVNGGGNGPVYDDWGNMVSAPAAINMDDFSSDQIAIGNSFNGKGNDSQYNVNQSNDMNDDDTINDAGDVKYQPQGGPDIHQGDTIYVDNDATAKAAAIALAKQKAEGGKGGDGEDGVDDVHGGKGGDGKGHYYKGEGGKGGDVLAIGKGGDGGDGGKGVAINAAAAGAVALNKSKVDIDGSKNIINANDGEPFQKVTAKGGEANSGIGINGDSNADENGEDGLIDGSSTATADALADATAFTADVSTGGNQQANFADLTIVNGDDNAEGGKHGKKGHDSDGGHDGSGADGLVVKGSEIWHLETDNDVNDLDTSDLINVEAGGVLNMDDFDLDITAIGDSFNGPGNDMQFSFDQANDLSDNDVVNDAGDASYHGSFLDGPFQHVQATGGTSTAADGIKGKSSASGNGGDGSVAGSALASSDAVATAQAFTANVVVGANVQVNNLAANVVGGDSFDDDLG